MNQDPVLNLDLDDGILYVEYPDGTKHLVQTSSRIDPMSILLEDGQYLKAKDFEGNWQYITDEFGERTSLKGERGPQGPEGKAGKDAADLYRLELADDADLIFVDSEFKAIGDLNYAVKINVLKNGQLLSNFSTFGLTIKSIRPNVDFNSMSWYTPSDGCYHIEIPNGYHVNDSELMFTINLVDSNLSVLSSKNFRLKSILGTIDYDLHVTPGYIKLDSESHTQSDSVLVKLKKKQVQHGNSTSTIINPSDLPEEYTIEYYLQDKPYDKISLLNNYIDLSKFELFADSIICIDLKHNGTVIDTSLLECIKDGIDGISPTQFVLSNEFDLIYVIDNKIITPQSYRVSVENYKGDELQVLSDIELSIPENYSDIISDINYTYSENRKMCTISFTVNACNIEIPETINLSITDKTYVKYFTLKRLSGTVDYDLHLDLRAVKVHLNSAGKYVCDNDAIVVGVMQREIGINTGSATLIKDAMPDYLEIWYSVNNGLKNKSIYQPGDHNYDYPHSCIWLKDVPGSNQNIHFDDKPQLVSIYLKNKNTGLILDLEDVPIIYDGSDGAPSYYLDLSNDYDQLYYNKIRFIPNQADFESIITFYKGVDKLELNENNTTVTITSPWDNRSEYTINYEDGSIKLIIDWDKVDLPSIIVNSRIPNQIEYKILISSTVYENGVPHTVDLLKFIKFAIVHGVDDYDIQLEKTTASKDKNGSVRLKRAIPIQIWHTQYGIEGALRSTKSVENLNDAGLSLLYSVDGGLATKLTSEEVPISILQEAEESVKVLLLKNQDILDYAVIDIIYDGLDGNDSLGYSISLSNDSALISVLDDLLVFDTVSTEIRVFKNGRIQNTDSYDIKCTLNGSILEGVWTRGDTLDYWEFKYTFTEIPSNISSEFVITATFDQGSVVKVFPVKKISGNTIYTLDIPNIVVLTPDSKFKSNQLHVLAYKEVKYPDGSGYEKTYLSDLDNVNLVWAGFQNNNVQYLGEGKWAILIHSGYVDINTVLNTPVQLVVNGAVVDEEYVDAMSEVKGDTGPTSTQLICTSGNVYTFYVNALNKPLANNVQTVSLSWRGIDSQGNNTTVTSGLSSTFGSGLTSNNFTADSIKLALQSGTVLTPGSYTITYTHSTYGTSVITVNIVQGALSYDLKCNPGYIKKNSDSTYSPITFSVYRECSGGGLEEEEKIVLNSSCGLTLKWGDDTLLTSYSNGDIVYTPVSDALATVYLRNGDKLLDFQVLTVVKDGLGMIDSFPTDPQIGDTYTWGGQLLDPKTPCIPYIALPGKTYMYTSLGKAELMSQYYTNSLSLYDENYNLISLTGLGGSVQMLLALVEILTKFPLIRPIGTTVNFIHPESEVSTSEVTTFFFKFGKPDLGGRRIFYIGNVPMGYCQDWKIFELFTSEYDLSLITDKLLCIRQETDPTKNDEYNYISFAQTPGMSLSTTFPYSKAWVLVDPTSIGEFRLGDYYYFKSDSSGHDPDELT